MDTKLLAEVDKVRPNTAYDLMRWAMRDMTDEQRTLYARNTYARLTTLQRQGLIQQQRRAGRIILIRTTAAGRALLRSPEP